MIADSVAFLVGEGKRVIYDAEHFFDGWRADREYALACVRAAAEAGAENVTLCDTNGASLPGEVADGGARGGRRRAAASASTATTTPSAGWRTRWPRWPRARVLVQGTLNGYGERCGNANLTSIVPNLQLKLGHECLPALDGLTEASHLVAELLNLDARRQRALRGQERVRAQGRAARRGRGRRPGDVRAHRPGAGRQRARGAGERALGQGHAGRPRRRRPRRRRAPRASSSASRSSSTAASSSRPPTARWTC